MPNQVLLTVSGTIAPDVAAQAARGVRPRADYYEMARAFGADILDYAGARKVAGPLRRLLERIGGPDMVLAWACFKLRRRYRVIFTDGEQVGIPLAAMLKLLTPLAQHRPRHLMITHIISVPKKMVFLDRLKVQSHIDRFFVYATRQKRFIEERWKIAPERVVWTPFMVDTRFFTPERVVANPTSKPTICAVGLERRDYPTLLKAVAGLDVHVIIAAASPWSRRSDSTENQTIPANVTVRRYTQYELRQLYADSRFLVMPLENVEFQAGVTALLEAMAMERAVICSRTAGQTDVVVAGETGLYVPPGDVQALRQAIAQLLAHPEEAARMGKAGRRHVEQRMSLDCYVESLSRYVHADTPSACQGEPHAGASAG